MNILMIGPTGCGKTTIGKIVAESCGLAFVDLDDRVLAEFNEPTVQEIWAAHGEAAWRATEVDALREVLSSEDQVLSLGGGTPMIAEARAMIESASRSNRAYVVYLKCSVDVLENRLQVEVGDRPSLTGGSVADEIGGILREREPIYEALACFIHPSDGQDAHVTAANVVKVAFGVERQQ